MTDAQLLDYVKRMLAQVDADDREGYCATVAELEAKFGEEDAKAMARAALAALVEKLETPGLRVVCTALPGPGDACVFVELEDANGRSLRREWEKRPDGLVHLRVTP